MENSKLGLVLSGGGTRGLAHAGVLKFLNEKNKLRNKKIVSQVSNYADAALLKSVPTELMMSLVIGATESYCRAWLSGKVVTSPKAYRETLAQAAWDSLQNLEHRI